MTDTRTLNRAFEQMAAWRPDSEVFVQAQGGEDRRYTFAEADALANRFAAGLAELGVTKGDRVALLSNTTVEHAIAYYAVVKTGGISATLHAREAPNVIEALVEHIDATALVFQPGFGDVVERFRDSGAVEHLIGFDQLGEVPDFAQGFSEIAAAEGASPPDVDITPADRAFINFSSGTTGRPKAIVHTHEQAVEASHLGGQYFLKPTNESVFLNTFTPSFIGWQNCTLPIVNVGGTTVFLEEWDPAAIPGIIEREEVTVAMFVPTQWKMILQGDIESYDMSSIKRCGYAGEPMGGELFKQVQEEIAPKIFSVYGSTETMTSGTALLPHEVTVETLDSVGRPMPNTDVRIVEAGERDPELTVPTGEIGELLVRSPPVANEVWENPEKTKDLFHEDGWWFSGDLAYADETGNIYLEGRLDNMIISGGINIYAEGVEQLLETHPAIVESGVVAMPHEEWGETVKAFVVATESITAEELDEWCRGNDDMSNYQRPREYEFVESMPRTNTGKLNRQALRTGGSE